jgi:hypothetical protein
LQRLFYFCNNQVQTILVVETVCEILLLEIHQTILTAVRIMLSLVLTPCRLASI